MSPSALKGSGENSRTPVKITIFLIYVEVTKEVPVLRWCRGDTVNKALPVFKRDC